MTIDGVVLAGFRHEQHAGQMTSTSEHLRLLGEVV